MNELTVNFTPTAAGFETAWVAYTALRKAGINLTSNIVRLVEDNLNQYWNKANPVTLKAGDIFAIRPNGYGISLRGKDDRWNWGNNPDLEYGVYRVNELKTGELWLTKYDQEDAYLHLLSWGNEESFSWEGHSFPNGSSYATIKGVPYGRHFVRGHEVEVYRGDGTIHYRSQDDGCRLVRKWTLAEMNARSSVA